MKGDKKSKNKEKQGSEKQTKQKKKDKGGKKGQHDGANPEEEGNGPAGVAANSKYQSMKDVELADFQTHADAAKALSQCLTAYKANSPSAINTTVINWMHK